jgi:acetolactate synthase-1/2/3 large subunit
LRANATEWAGRIAAATGCAVMSECLVARLERGAGRVMVPRLPYAVDPTLAVLAQFEKIVLVGAKEPVAFFAYPGKPGILSRPGCECITLASRSDDLQVALQALSDALGASTGPVALVASSNGAQAMESFHGPIDADNVARLLVALMPANAIVVDEAVTMGRSFDKAAQGAAPHDWLTVMGGSIGFALPAAVGAAIAAPDRKVIALEGDGSGMYTLQALWTMVRENLNITVVIFANRAYKILLGEFSGVGAGVPGQRATDMLSLDRPDLDWVALAKGMGMQASRVSDMGGFCVGLQKALAVQGPALVEVVL